MNRQRPSLHDGVSWHSIQNPSGLLSSPHKVDDEEASKLSPSLLDRPVPPKKRHPERKMDGEEGGQKQQDEAEGCDGCVFVSIPSFRDGERCAKTIKSLYENAKQPENVYVGLVEQNNTEEDITSCLQEYCSSYDHAACPYYDQIRYLAIHHFSARGPTFARSLAQRKLLANEEFCLQIDAHSDFAKSWDETVINDWYNAENEFAVLSTVPAPVTEKAEGTMGGSRQREVPRMCRIIIPENGIPTYDLPADGKVVNLDRPLLSHGWSAGFSFAKCHLEENVPYDNFALQVFDAEQFPRFVRLWTRGYDVYTPTRNIIFHHYSPNPHEHDPKGWTKSEPERQASLKRIKTFLQIPGGDTASTSQANLGLYGLGKRRTLEQCLSFAGFDNDMKWGAIGTQTGGKCVDHTWVPYDSTIHPMENMFENPDDLDPQPEYPLRTLKQRHIKLEKANAYRLDHRNGLEESDGLDGHQVGASSTMASTKASTTFLVLLWFLGMFLWQIAFVIQRGEKITLKQRKGKKGIPPEKIV